MEKKLKLYSRWEHHNPKTNMTEILTVVKEGFHFVTCIDNQEELVLRDRKSFYRYSKEIK